MTDRRKPDTPRPSAARLRAAAFLVGLAGLLAAVFVANRRAETPAEQPRRQLREEVPGGAGRAEVAAWAGRAGGRLSAHANAPADLPPPPQTTLADLVGRSRAEQACYVEVLIPWGRYRVWRDGSTADNHMWVMLPLDPAGRVTGHHLLTLEELAGIERRRSAPRAAGR